MFKDKLLKIKESTMSKYRSVYTESVDENDSVVHLRKMLELGEEWESSYNIEDFSKNVLVKFTNGDDVIEIKFISSVGNEGFYSLLFNDKRIITKDNSTDEIPLINKIIDTDTVFQGDIKRLKETMKVLKV